MLQKKSSSSKMSLRDKMKKAKEEAKQRSQGGDMTFLKEGSLRIRILSPGEEEEFIMEVTYFYLGKELKGMISPSTFGEPCAAMEAYDALKASDDQDNKELAKSFAPKRKWIVVPLVYKDTKGKQIDDQKSLKPILIPSSSLYQEILDLFLNEDDWDNMLDNKKGYDITLNRTGSGQMDTEYHAQPCSRSAIPLEWAKKKINLEKSVRAVMPSYEETKQKIEEFLGIDLEEVLEGSSSKKKSSSKSSDKPKKKVLLKK